MTVQEFINTLENLKPELKDKEIVISTLINSYAEPIIKLNLKDPHDFFNYSRDNVSEVIITY